jgi:hypothetical protein
MAHHKLGDKEQSRKWYDEALTWLAANQPTLAKNKQLAEELRRFRAEAEKLLDVQRP